MGQVKAKYYNAIPPGRCCAAEGAGNHLPDCRYAAAPREAPIGFVTDHIVEGPSCTLCGATMVYKCLSCGSTPECTAPREAGTPPPKATLELREGCIVPCPACGCEDIEHFHSKTCGWCMDDRHPRYRGVSPPVRAEAPTELGTCDVIDIPHAKAAWLAHDCVNWKKWHPMVESAAQPEAGEPLIICPVCERSVDRMCDAKAVQKEGAWYHEPCSRFASRTAALEQQLQLCSDAAGHKPHHSRSLPGVISKLRVRAEKAESSLAAMKETIDLDRKSAEAAERQLDAKDAEIARWIALDEHLPAGYAIGDDATATLAVELAQKDAEIAQLKEELEKR